MVDPGRLAMLRHPLSPNHVEWRVGNVSQRGSCTLLAYLTSRGVQDRLDEVIGPENWQDSYREGPNGGLMCGIAVRVGDDWVWKWDGAENTQVEAIKGGFSGAFKRAAVKWGIGRYLYGLDTGWHKIQDGWANGRGIDVSSKGKHIGWVPQPRLPAWAMPSGAKDTGRSARSDTPDPEPPAPFDPKAALDALAPLGWSPEDVTREVGELTRDNLAALYRRAKEGERPATADTNEDAGGDVPWP